MTENDPERERDDRCDSCRTGEPCPICQGNGCGWCPDCSPEVPEW